MKKFLLTITAIFVTLLTMAQSPNLMNYQGVARNAVGNVIPNQLIGLRLSILSGSATGTVVYSETRNVFTNAFGLFNVVLGSPGTLAQTGTIAGVNWSGFPSGGASKFLQVEIDPQGGSNFTNVGSTQMVSVPYALNAGGAAPIGPAGGDLTGTYPNPLLLFPILKTFNSTTLTPSNTELLGLTNTSPNSANGAITGTSSSNAANTTAITGTLTSTASAAGSAALRGVNQSTNALGAGVVGTQAGGGNGVLGQAASGSGVRGESGGAGAGVYGQSASGAGVYGTSTTGSAGIFENTNNANTATTLFATTNSNGNGTAVNGINTGTSGRGGLFQVTNGSNGSSALEAQTAGAAASWGIRSTSTGPQGAGIFVQSNAANTANNLRSDQAGLGTAGFFQTTNTANNADAILGASSTTGTVASGVHGTAGTSGITVAAKKGVWGDTDTGWGVYGTSSTSAGVAGTTNTGTGVSAFAFTTGTALSAQSLTGVSASITTPAGNTANTMNISTAGTGAAASIDNTNATNVSNTIQATNANSTSFVTSQTTGGGAAIFARKGAGLGTIITNPSTVYASVADPASGPNGIGVVGITNNGYGVTGFTIGNGFGVLGQATTAGSAGLVGVNFGAGYGLVTVGKVQIQGQGAGAGKVLSSDAVGNATWNTLAALGGVSGSGTLNWVPKWTPNGTTLGNSQIFDDGTNVGVGTGSPNGKLDVANGSATVRGMQVINSSTTNPSSTIFAQNNSIGGADPVESAAVTGLFSPIAVATPIIAGPTAIKGIGSPTATVGFAGGMGVQGASGNGVGVAGISNNGTGVYAFGVAGTSYALQTNGRVQIQGQGAGAGKLLSSDATGNATWNTAAALNIVSGNGTLNFIPKWSPDGNTLANSQVFDDGTQVRVGTPGTVGTGSTLNVGSSTATASASVSFATGGQGFNINENAAGQLNFEANNTGVGAGQTIMTIDDDGVRGVGIGTTNPIAKLSVDNLTAGQGGLRVNQTTEASIPAVKSLSGGVAVGDGSANFPATLGTNSIYSQRGDFTSGTVTTSLLNESGVVGFAPAGTGVQGLSVTGRGVVAFSTNGVGLRAFSNTGNAIETNSTTGLSIKSTGAIQLAGIGEANGRVLTSDAIGNATWQDAPAKSLGFSAYLLTSSLSIPSTVFTTVTNWTNLQEDGGANYGAGIYTITKAGVYQINAGMRWDPFTANAQFVILNVVAGSTIVQDDTYGRSGENPNTTVSFSRRLNVGDQVYVQLFQSTGVNQTVSAGYAANHFSVQYIHN